MQYTEVLMRNESQNYILFILCPLRGTSRYLIVRDHLPDQKLRVKEVDYDDSGNCELGHIPVLY